MRSVWIALATLALSACDSGSSPPDALTNLSVNDLAVNEVVTVPPAPSEDSATEADDASADSAASARESDTAPQDTATPRSELDDADEPAEPEPESEDPHAGHDMNSTD